MLLALTWETGVALGLSIVATVVAVTSAWFAYQANRRAGGAEDRAKRAEKRAERVEHRDEERLRRERERVEPAAHALLVINARGAQRGNDAHHFGFTIENDGPVPADDIDVWIVDEDGDDVTRAHPNTFALKPDEERENWSLVVRIGPEPEKLRFALKWNDRGGGGTKITDVHPAY